MKRLQYVTGCVIICALFVGCCPCRHLTTSTRDSVRVETVIRTERVPDTVLVEVPVETIRQTVRDTTSHLETSFAVSDAQILADGSLYHSLKNIPQKRPVPIEKEIEYHETNEYHGQETTDVIEVERKLTWWQQTQMRGFWAAIIFLVIIYRRKIFETFVRLYLNK